MSNSVKYKLNEGYLGLSGYGGMAFNLNKKPALGQDLNITQCRKTTSARLSRAISRAKN